MLFLVRHLFATGLLATMLPSVLGNPIKSAKLRTVVTTDMEQDDLASLIRYLLYTNDLDTEGIIYTSSVYHWAGDGKGTVAPVQYGNATYNITSLRWTGNTTIQDIVIPAYAQVYPNLRRHDPSYPTPNELLAMVKLGNIDFEGEMDHDTDGSNLIRSLLLDHDPRPIYLQAWGGTNTIARALKSIEECFSNSSRWASVKDAVSRKAVIMASGFQDMTYTNYISQSWPDVRTENFEAGYATWGYNCNTGSGNTRGLPDNVKYFSGDFIKKNIEMGPYGKLYRSWLDGQSMPGDPADVFGNPATAGSLGFCKPLQPYDFLSEGDNVAYNPLLTTGIQDPNNPTIGGWGGRSTQNSTSPDLWNLVASEMGPNGTEIAAWNTARWAAAVQNDFAARMQWTVTPTYRDGNHAPSVEIRNGNTVQGRAGKTVALSSTLSDPDGNNVTPSWWQYLEEGTYPGYVTVIQQDHGRAMVAIPSDAKRGQTISIILQGTDDGDFPLTRYDRVFIQVV
jgi:hypothetical protein